MKSEALLLPSHFLPLFLLLAACSGAEPQSHKTQTGTIKPVEPQNQNAEVASDGGEPVAAPSAAPGPVDPKTPPAEQVQPVVVPAATFSISSPAFLNGQPFPATFVAKGGGGNQSPPLEWKGVPPGTGSFVVQMVDLDFRTPPFIHWLISGIPASSGKLPTAIPAGNNLAAPLEAKGANQPKAYAGPNPPALHRYEITVYAIKQGLMPSLGTTDSAANKADLEAKSLGKATIIGTYQ